MGFQTDGIIMLFLALLAFWFYFNLDSLPANVKQTMPSFMKNKMFSLGIGIFLACLGSFQIIYGK